MPPLHPLQAAADALQQIVEVVGDAAGQLPDGFHLLRLAQRLLGLLQLAGALGHPLLQGGIEVRQSDGQLLLVLNIRVRADPARHRTHAGP